MMDDALKASWLRDTDRRVPSELFGDEPGILAWYVQIFDHLSQRRMSGALYSKAQHYSHLVLGYHPSYLHMAGWSTARTAPVITPALSALVGPVRLAAILRTLIATKRSLTDSANRPEVYS